MDRQTRLSVLARPVLRNIRAEKQW